MSQAHINVDDNVVVDDASLSIATMPICELFEHLDYIDHERCWMFHLTEGTMRYA